MFFGEPLTRYYYLVIALQIICVVHCMKTGRKDWIYLLVFLPFVGCVAYFVREIMPGLSTGNSADNLQRALLPGLKTRELERRLRIADTDANRLNLAAEYTRLRDYPKAIQLTQACLTGIYANDPNLLMDMARLHFYNGQYQESRNYFNRALPLRNNRIDRPEDEIVYARVLENTGDIERATEEYKKTIRLHHSMEAMYYYGLFLKKQGKVQDAMQQFSAIQQEKDLHPKYVRRLNYRWIRLSRKELSAR